MKKKLWFATALVVAGIGLFTGCGKTAKDEGVTLQKIYEANAVFADGVDGKTVVVDFDIIAEGNLLGDASVKANGTLSYSKTASHVEANYEASLLGESMKDSYIIWYDDAYSYTYNAKTGGWKTEEVASTTVGEVTSGLDTKKAQKYIDKLQEQIDDKDNGDVTLTKTSEGYVLAVNVKISDLLQMDELSSVDEEIGSVISSLKGIQGRVVMAATFDSETLVLKSMEITVDDAAKKALADTLALMGISGVEVKEAKVIINARIEDGMLEIPAEAKETPVEPAFNGPVQNSIMEQLFGDVFSEDDLIAEMGDPDGTIDFDNPVIGEISVRNVVSYLYRYIANCTDATEVYAAAVSFVDKNADTKACVENALGALVAIQSLGEEELFMDLVTYIDKNCSIISSQNLDLAYIALVKAF